MNTTEQNELDNLIRNISRLRLHNKLSKKEMADIMGVSLKTINKIEKGEFPQRLGANNIYNICMYFKIRASELFEKSYCKLMFTRDSFIVLITSVLSRARFRLDERGSSILVKYGGTTVAFVQSSSGFTAIL